MGEAMTIYHVWFATKNRRWLLEGDVEDLVVAELKKVAAQHNIDLLAIGTMIDHVHLLIRLEEGQTLPRCMNLIKGGSARRVFRELPELKLDIGVEHLWQKRYGSKLVPPGAVPAVKRYVVTQKERLEKYEA
jgi:REP element-mobilizing transposase RayT